MFSFTVAALVQAAAPASTLYAQVNGWYVFDFRGTCSATTVYGADTRVVMEYDFGANVVDFIITKPAWESIEHGRSYPVSLRFSNGQEYPDTQARGVRIDREDGRRTGITLHLNGLEFLADFAGSAAMGLFMRDTRLEVLNLEGTRAAVARLRSCSSASWRRYPPDPFASERPPQSAQSPPSQVRRIIPPQRARANLNSYMSMDDYPAEALRANEQGTTGFNLTIGPDGRVADCRVTSSSGSAALDQATCRILRSRARYTPARDGAGNPTSGTDSGRMTWRLPAS